MSDLGRVRTLNEDQFLIADLHKSMIVEQTTLSHEDRTRLFGRSQGQLLVVADGMGGLGSGDKASRIAVSTIIRYALNTMDWFFRLAQERPDDLRDELVQALGAAQRTIEGMVGERPGASSMGTTLTMAYVLWPRVYVVHAGDSRCYLQRHGQLEQITKDHTVASQLVEKKILPRHSAARWSNVLWSFIGGSKDKFNPEVYRLELQAGDALLLCTDGLTRHVSDETIADVLSAGMPPMQTCKRLVDQANSGGGRDNITVIVARTDMTPQISSVMLEAVKVPPKDPQA